MHLIFRFQVCNVETMLCFSGTYLSGHMRRLASATGGRVAELMVE